MRQVDHSHPLAQLLTQRMPIPRRSRCIIEPLDHEKGGGPAAPPIFNGTFRLVARCARWTAGQHSTCSSTLGSDAGESQRAPNMVTQSLPFILTCVALRKAVPSGVGGPMRPPAASNVRLRTSEG